MIFHAPALRSLERKGVDLRRWAVHDAFELALLKTLPILERIREGFGPYPTSSTALLEQLNQREFLAVTEEGSPPPATSAPENWTLEALRDAALVCVKCPHLVRSRTQVVFGVGNAKAELMFVGEAPGVEEDAKGEPFVGRAGQLLTRIIEAMGFRREGVYIANVLKCRPDMPASVSGNRKPRSDEMRTCLPWLEKQIDLIKPRVMVALGATAVEGLFGATTSVSKVRGRWLDFHGIPVMVTYHPAYLLRNQAVSEKRKVWEDMLQVLERLGKSITEKQRKFFTKSEG